jgi:hypothetical protein
VSERDDLFTERGLSPRRVAFWLHHWQELRTLAETPGSSRDLREYVRREWIRLQERHPSIVCLCGPTDSEPQRPSAYAGGGTYGPSSTFATDLHATLLEAADALPFPWRVTRVVFALQQRPGEYDYIKRFDLWRHDARRDHARDALPEPQGTDEYALRVAIERMAAHSGWRRLDKSLRSA